MEKNILNFYKKKEEQQSSDMVNAKQEIENYGSINIFYAANDGGQGIPTLRQESVQGKANQENTLPGTLTQPANIGFLQQQTEEKTSAPEVSPELWTKEMVAEKLKKLEHESQEQEYDLFSNGFENKGNVIAFGALGKGEKPIEPTPLVIAHKQEEKETIAPLAEPKIGMMPLAEPKIAKMPMAEKESIDEIPNIFEKPKEAPKETLFSKNLNFSNLFSKANETNFSNLFKNSEGPNFFGNFAKTTEGHEEMMEMTNTENVLENQTEQSDGESFHLAQEETMLEMEEMEAQDECYALDQGIMSLEMEEEDIIAFEEETASFATTFGEPENAEIAEIEEIEEMSLGFSERADEESPREKDYLDYYSDENAYTISNSYDDLRAFIKVCDDSTLRKVTLSEPVDEKIILINGAFSKILLTDAYVMLEDGQIEEAKELLQKICLTSLDAKVANRAFFKLEELKEKYNFMDVPIENTFYQCLKKEEQLIDRLKRIE